MCSFGSHLLLSLSNCLSLQRLIEFMVINDKYGAITFTFPTHNVHSCCLVQWSFHWDVNTSVCLLIGRADTDLSREQYGVH